MVESRPSLGNSGGVADHADCAGNLGDVGARYCSWRLVVDTDLEPSWTPVNKLDGTLGLDGGDGGVDILGDNVSPVEHTAGHVLPITRVAFDHLVGWLETGVGDLRHS